MASWSGRDRKSRRGDEWKRKKKGGASEAAPAWRQRPTDRSSNLRRLTRRRREVQWGIYALVAAALVGVFLYALLRKPENTPVVLATGLDYPAPIPPNSWAEEDAKSYHAPEMDSVVAPVSLDQRGWNTSNPLDNTEFVDALKRNGRRYNGFRKIREPLIVYFNMPGVVDAAGVPHLLRPGASPFNSNEWVSIDAIADAITNPEFVAPERTKLLVLNCNHYVINWDLGIVYNTFAERIQKHFEGREDKNLAVMIAAGAGQQSWASRHLQGTAFGQFFRLGLAGEADLGSGGDGNGEVSLNELDAYVRREVSRWAATTRGAAQTPEFVVRPEEDLLVSHSLGRKQIDAMRDKLAKTAPPQPAVEPDDIGRLWLRLDQVEAADAVRFDPLWLADMQRRLVRLEQLAFAGSRYRDAARKLSRSLDDRLTKAAGLAERRGRSLASYWGVTNQAAERLRSTGLATLPLREYFDPDFSDAEQIEKLWDWIENPNNNAGATKFAPALIESACGLETSQWLVANRQEKVTSFARAGARLRRLLALRRDADVLAAPWTSREGEMGGPGDEQAHYAVRAVLERGDSHRRWAEDALFVGDSPTIGKEWEQWTDQAASDYRAAKRIRQKHSQAFKTCVSAWADAPAFALWACRAQGRLTNSTDDSPKETLISFLSQADELGRDVCRLEGLRPDAGGKIDLERLEQRVDSLDIRANDLARAHELLRGLFENAADLGDVTGGKERRAFDWVLSTPLVEPDRRAEMLTKREKLSGVLHARHFSGGGASDSSVNLDSNVIEHLSAWQPSPLLAILDPGSKSEGKGLERFEQENHRARNRLVELTRIDVQRAEGEAPHYLDDRLALSDAARRVRAAAALLPKAPKVDPIERLRKFDLQQLLIWHAGRSLDGFWQTVANPDSPTVEAMLNRPASTSSPPKPHFEQAAKRCLDAVEQYRLPSDVQPLGPARQIESLRGRLRVLGDASRQGIATVSGRVNTGPVVDLDVISKEEAAPLLNGRMAVYLAQQPHGRVRVERDPSRAKDAGWGYVDLDGEMKNPALLSARARGVQGSVINMVVFFRGHRVEKPLTVPGINDAPLEYEWPTYEGQTVTLLGKQPAPPSLVFILDCSNSMSEDVEDLDGGKSSRMMVAKAALREMFSTMANESRRTSYSVGVTLFGHRVGFGEPKSRFERREKRINSAYAELPGVKFDQNLAPGQDVESIVPLGRFTPMELGDVRERLEAVVPLGVTPVYLAITKALDELSSDRNPSQAVIVITDGGNDQNDYTQNPKTSAEDVEAKWNDVDKEIPIYIIGFGIEEDTDDTKLKRGIVEFKGIAEHTGGEWLPTDSGSALINELLKRLKVHGYLVREVDGKLLTSDRNGNEEKIELGRSVPVPMSEDRSPVDLEVSFKNTAEQVTLEGGEALQMRVSATGRFVPIPYDDQVAESQLLVDADGVDSSHLLRIHAPRRRGERVDFHFSVQDKESHFTRRPDSIWIEVTADRTNRTYWFYDRVYQPDVHVPVIKFPVTNWPVGANHARVKFWCTDPSVSRPIRPLKAIRLSDVFDQRSTNESFREAVELTDGKADLRIKLFSEDGEHRVEIKEAYGKGTASIGSIRPGLVFSDAAMRPQRVRHEYYPEDGFASHSFYFSAGGVSLKDFSQKVAIRIDAAEAIKRDALRVADDGGIRVRIVNADDTHTATTGAAQP